MVKNIIKLGECDRDNDFISEFCGGQPLTISQDMYIDYKFNFKFDFELPLITDNKILKKKFKLGD